MTSGIEWHCHPNTLTSCCYGHMRWMVSNMPCSGWVLKIRKQILFHRSCDIGRAPSRSVPAFSLECISSMPGELLPPCELIRLNMTTLTVLKESSPLCPKFDQGHHWGSCLQWNKKQCFQCPSARSLMTIVPMSRRLNRDPLPLHKPEACSNLQQWPDLARGCYLHSWLRQFRWWSFLLNVRWNGLWPTWPHLLLWQWEGFFSPVVVLPIRQIEVYSRHFSV